VEQLLVHPEPAPAWLAGVLDSAGYPWRAVADTHDALREEPEEGWSGAVVCVGDGADGGFALCRALRKREDPLQPLLIVVDRAQLEELDFREDLFDDFVVLGASAAEVEARLGHLFRRTGRGKQHDLIVHGPAEACREKILRYMENGVTIPAPMVIPVGVDLEDTIRRLAPG